ncbi:MAG: PAS domain S-box protein [Gemmatimonadetes bacterium]|nr:PAS domain S-box protein [Gemmatimonadota bacterium]
MPDAPSPFASVGLLQHIVEGVPIRIFWKDRELRYLGCNTLFARDAGVEGPAAVVGRTDFDLAWRAQAEQYRADDRAVMESGQARIDFEEPQTSPSGDLLWLRTSKVPLLGDSGAVIGVLGIYDDITARKQVELRLRESEERYQRLFDSSPDPCWIIDGSNHFVLCNVAAARALGYDRSDEVIERHPSEHSPLLQPDGRSSRDAANEMMAVAHEQGIHRFEWVHRRRDGTEFPVEVTLAQVVTEGEPQLYCIWRDISERKRFEASLLESRTRHEEAQHLAHLGHWQMDLATDHLEWSSEVYRIFGMESDGARATLPEFFSRVHPGDLEAVRAAFSSALDTHRRFEIEHRLLLPDGTTKWVHTRGEVALRPDGTPERVTGTVLDITERHEAMEHSARLQAQLHDAQRLEAIGRLAGGVAHDFNNMLSVILGGLEMSLSELGSNDRVAEYLREAQDAARRSADLTRQLLAFASRQTTLPVVLDLNAKVTGMLRMLRRVIGENVRLEWDPGPDIWPVHIDPSQVDQVLANLCVNARDAIAGVGRVHIATRNVVLDHAHVDRHPGAILGEHAVLTFRDDGGGMPPEVLEHIFEPFFTTKDLGKGTGLGLATVYGIVRQAKGHIVVTSAPGMGTTFELYFPVHRAAADATRERYTPATTIAQGGTILLVEDEPGVRRMTSLLLERLGYEVLAASSAQSALALLEAHRGRIDLLMTDVIMPDMNGRDLARQVRTRLPGLPTLFVSGYPSDAIPIGNELDANTHFIGKPFRFEELAALLRLALTPEAFRPRG